MSRLPSGDITVLFIHTRWRATSQKWVLDTNGLVEYNNELITPLELVRRFIVDHPNFDVMCADVCRRIDVGEGQRPYRWIEIERLV